MGAFLLPKVRRRISTDLLIVVATILFAIATLALAYLRNLGLIYIALIVGGVAWIALMSSLNVAVQFVVPSWVQARSLGVYQLVFQGGIAAGSAVWGIVAEHLGNSTALLGRRLG
jgi:predicted MFS family arabinose efflux permease